MRDPLDALFHALSDPTRRAILVRLMAGSAPVSDLARDAGLGMPTILAHLARLEQAGLVRSAKSGRVRTVRANPVALAPARRWLSAREADWHDRARRAAEPARTD